MRTLKDYAEDEGITYTAACYRAKKGIIKTFVGEKIVKRKVKIRFVLEEELVKG